MQQSLLLFECDIFKVTATLAYSVNLSAYFPSFGGSNNRQFLCRILYKRRGNEWN